MTPIQRDLTRTTLAILCLLLLIVGSLWVLRPFLGALVWATMIVVATWPMLKGLEQRFGGRRAPAVAVMTLAMLLLLFLPLLLAVDVIVSHADEFAALAKKLANSGLPQPPEWVAGLPLVGGKLHACGRNWPMPVRRRCWRGSSLMPPNPAAGCCRSWATSVSC
jgi:predicted PurR-regulated permease PerM